jgi:hypothetical protein
MGKFEGKADLDSVEPIEITLRYDPKTTSVSVDMDELTTFAEALGIISFAQMLVMTQWQSLHAFITQEEYDFDHYGVDDEE